MSPDLVEADLRRRVGEKVRLGEEGIGRYRVLTPFLFDDGDHLAIVIKQEGAGWVLSDEGHTYMHLTYELDERELLRGTRQTVISNALSAFGVEDRDGELLLPVPADRFGDALFSFVQALLRISDVAFLSRERVRSTFMDDFRVLIEGAVSPERRAFEWADPEHDPERKYTVDCRLNGTRRPIMVYALPNDDRVRDATICLLQFERWELPHGSVAIFEDQEEVNRKVLARFSDVCEKQFSSLALNRERIANYLREALAQPS